MCFNAYISQLCVYIVFFMPSYLTFPLRYISSKTAWKNVCGITVDMQFFQNSKLGKSRFCRKSDTEIRKQTMVLALMGNVLTLHNML